MQQINVAIFGKFPERLIEEIVAPKLAKYGVNVVKNYDVTRVRRTALAGVHACVYMYELSSHSEFDRARRIADSAGKPMFRLPRKEGTWPDPLGMLFKHFKLRPPKFEKEPPQLALEPVKEEPEAEVPPPPESGVQTLEVVVPAAPGSSEALPAGDDQQYAKALEEENARLRELVKNQQDMLLELGLRVKRAESLRMASGLKTALAVPEEAVGAMRMLVSLGALDALQLCDVVAHFSHLPKSAAA